MDKKRNSVRPHVVNPNPPASPTSDSNVRPSEGCDCLLYSCPKKHHNSGSAKRGIASGASINRSSTIRPDVEPGLPKIPAPSGGSNISAPGPLNAGTLGSAFNDVDIINAIYIAIADLQQRMNDYLRKIEKVQSGRTQVQAENPPGIPVRARLELFGTNTATKLVDVPAMWTIDDALTLVRDLRPKCIDHGYTLELGGGVLQNGSSERDLDLVLVPRIDMKPYTESTIIGLFEQAGYKLIASRDRKHLRIVNVSNHEGKLIDLIFVRVSRLG